MISTYSYRHQSFKILSSNHQRSKKWGVSCLAFSFWYILVLTPWHWLNVTARNSHIKIVSTFCFYSLHKKGGVIKDTFICVVLYSLENDKHILELVSEKWVSFQRTVLCTFKNQIINNHKTNFPFCLGFHKVQITC